MCNFWLSLCYFCFLFKGGNSLWHHVLTHNKKMAVIRDLYGVIMHPSLNTFQQKTKKSVGKIFFHWGLKFFDDFGQKWQRSNFHPFDYVTLNVCRFLTVSSRQLGPPLGERAKKIISKTPPTFENRMNMSQDMTWQSEKNGPSVGKTNLATVMQHKTT